MNQKSTLLYLYRRKSCFASLFFIFLCIATSIVKAETGPQLVNTITAYGTGGGTGGALRASWNSITATITVTNTGSTPITGATTTLILNIDADIYVVWNASLTGSSSINNELVRINGNTFEMAGGKIEQTGAGRAINVTGDITVSRGTISATTGTALNVDGLTAKAIISNFGIVSNSGTTADSPTIYITNNKNTGINVIVSDRSQIKTTGNGGYAIMTPGSVEITGNAEVSAISNYTIYAGGSVTVSGGIVNSYMGVAINCTGTTSKATVSDGVVQTGGLRIPAIRIVNNNNTGLNVSVCGTGKVWATGTESYAIVTGGSVEVKDNAEVGSDRGISIWANTVMVSGGTVSATSGSAIMATNVTVNGTGTVQATDNGGVAISATNVEVKDNARVSATDGRTIIVYSGSNGKVTINGGIVKNNSTFNSPVIHILDNNTDVTINGTGKVQATGGSYAIRTFGNVTVNDNAEISVTTGRAISSEGATGKVTVSGGVIKNSTVLSSNNPLIYILNTSNTGDNVTISGFGKVQATNVGSHAIRTYGNVSVSNNAEVSATTDHAIFSEGASSTVTVDGGMVNSVSGAAIYVTGISNNIIISGGTVSTKSGRAIYTFSSSNNEKVIVRGNGKVRATGSGGAILTTGDVEVNDNAEVSSIDRTAIELNGTKGKVTVSGGIVKNSATSLQYPAIYIVSSNQGDNVIVNGTGKVQANGVGGMAIFTFGNVTVMNSAEVIATTGMTILATGNNSVVTVSGGIVSTTTDAAITVNGTNGKITINGGAVFAYGTSITGANNVINSNNFTGPTGTGVVIAWNQAAGNTSYAKGTANNLAMQPAGCAVWDYVSGKGGITYTNSTNKGFIPLDVTISGIPPVNAQAPTITTHPQSASVAIGAHSLTVAATSPDGGTLRYQWYSNTSASNTGGTAVTGATAAGYTVPINRPGTFHYYVVVTNTITDNGDGGAKTATATSNVATLTVTQPTVVVTGVSLNKSALTLAVGVTEQLTATVAPANATNKNVTWSSSNTTAATVSSNGTVTARAAGSATITVTTQDGGKTAACTITVTQASVAVTGVNLDKPTLTLAVGGTEQLTATVAPANATNKNVTWSSSNTAAATVSSDGTITAQAAGSAMITVTTQDGNKTATCTVTVKEGVTGTEDLLKIDVKLFPNPFTDKLHLTGAEGCMLRIVTGSGVTVHVQKITNADESIPTEHLPAGIYLFRLEKDGKAKTVKGVKN